MYTHTYVCTYPQVCMFINIHIHIYLYTQTHAYIHTCAYNACIHKHVDVYTSTHTHGHTSTHTHVHTYIYIIHIHMHTYSYLYVCILIKICTLSKGMAPQVQCMYVHACILHNAHLLACTHSNEVVPLVLSPSETSVRRGGGGGLAGERSRSAI